MDCALVSRDWDSVQVNSKARFVKLRGGVSAQFEGLPRLIIPEMDHREGTPGSNPGRAGFGIGCVEVRASVSIHCTER